MKYCIRYTKNENYTTHYFGSVKELKIILTELKNIKVEWKFECNTPQIAMLCVEHNNYPNIVYN